MPDDGAGAADVTPLKAPAAPSQAKDRTQPKKRARFEENEESTAGQAVKRARLEEEGQPAKGVPLEDESTAAQPTKDVRLEDESTAGQPTKRARVEDGNTAAAEATLPKNDDLLMLMPLELLAEVLISTRSTKDILTVSRCSGYLYKTLCGPSGAFVWKKTRQATLPEPLPDPPAFINEYQYAAFLFDGGKCEVCQVNTKEFYASFAIKLRICQREECHKWRRIKRSGFYNIEKGTSPGNKIVQWTPVMESAIPEPLEFDFWPDATAWCRTTVWERNVKQWKLTERSIEDYEQFQKAAIKKNKEWMTFCVDLFKWKSAHAKAYALIKEHNEIIARRTVTQKGYDFNDVLNNTCFGVLYRIRTKHLEKVSEQDFDKMAQQVQVELSKLAEKRKRREREASYRTIREALHKHYQTIRAEGKNPVLPSFATFCRLPVTSSLLALAGRDTSKSIQNMLRKDGVGDVIKNELKKWENDARKKMAAVSGYPNWKVANIKDCHPVDRLSVLFRCKKCSEDANGRYPVKLMTFAQACEHECLPVPGQKRRHLPWDASDFVKEEKVFNTLQTLISLVDLQDTRAPANIAALKRQLNGQVVQCLSCEPYSLINVPMGRIDNLIRHCQRHETMEFRLVKTTDVFGGFYGKYPVVDGIVKVLSDRAKRLQDNDPKNCGCRYCLYRLAQQPDNSPTAEELEERMQQMGFNGLKSHLKTKHHIFLVGDEDVVVFG
ncbi:hypothetical protein AMATHDRAFT_62303 [Amanita thiersii Skay4041]|uniref:F-box domain-containing protein n=1 Tax=Amanita thiersii Skay4041 TaxID=703135 RepID=A0A2A9NFW4_9AGAR|nr:hypothetical protein AMATHDRAFT_62303 [Amanita thiersii Skay4041]